MNPRSGEKAPFISSSRSQICRGVRSQDCQSRDSACNLAQRSGLARRFTKLPPCGAIGGLDCTATLVATPAGFLMGWVSECLEFYDFAVSQKREIACDMPGSRELGDPW